MTLADFAHLPSPVLLLVVVMVWPAIWALAGLTTAFLADIARPVRRRRDFSRQRELPDGQRRRVLTTRESVK